MYSIDMEYYGNVTRGNMLAVADNEHGDPTNCSTFMVICVEDNNETLIENACDVSLYNLAFGKII